MSQQIAHSELSNIEKFVYQLKRFPGRWQPPDEILLIGSALLVGVGTGFGAVVFIWLLDQINVHHRYFLWIKVYS